MNVSQASEKWGISKNKVQYRCEKRMVIGVSKDDLGRYEIPNCAREPYLSKATKNVKTIYCKIIDAARNNKSINDKSFNMSAEKLDFYISECIRLGYIEEVEFLENGDVIYRALNAGVEYQDSREYKNKELLINSFGTVIGTMLK